MKGPRQRLAHNVDQRRRGKRLLHHRRIRKFLADVASRKFGIAGHERHARVRARGLQLHGQFPAAHSRHHYIAQQQVNHTRIAARHGQGFHPSAGLQHRVALHAQKLASQFAHAALILHDKHCFASRWYWLGLFFRFSNGLSSRLRQVNFKRRA